MMLKAPLPLSLGRPHRLEATRNAMSVLLGGRNPHPAPHNGHDQGETKLAKNETDLRDIVLDVCTARQHETRQAGCRLPWPILFPLHPW